MEPYAGNQKLKAVIISGFEELVTPEVLYNYLKKYNLKSTNMNKLQMNATAEFPSEAMAKEAINSRFGKSILNRQIQTLKCP